MIVRFSQKWAKAKYGDLVREAIRFVKGSRVCKDLLVKVMFYTSSKPEWRGNYRSVYLHGFFDSEFTLNRKLKNQFEHVITLKIPRAGSEVEIQKMIVQAFGHEFKHYLDMRKLRSKKRFRHWEVRADKFSKKMLERWQVEQKSY